ncbi:hypothetical protein [Microbacterium sp. IEGM 1404]|uniref:hypothetical protein n=1 Tax=Microbacterium sp. IEGM 1404 TaxID=3047084 RepID=UPI0024B79C45|nr:hypothetical protein [Microbacterium sp. IEGM 1404]
MQNTSRVSAAAALLAVVFALAGCGIPYDGDTTGCTVTDKYVAVADKSSEKRVSTSCGVFKVEDELSQGDWNSADRYAQIEVGKTYDFETYGFRNGFLSSFPNIARVTETR